MLTLIFSLSLFSTANGATLVQSVRAPNGDMHVKYGRTQSRTAHNKWNRLNLAPNGAQGIVPVPKGSL